MWRQPRNPGAQHTTQLMTLKRSAKQANQRSLCETPGPDWTPTYMFTLIPR